RTWVFPEVIHSLISIDHEPTSSQELCEQNTIIVATIDGKIWSLINDNVPHSTPRSTQSLSLKAQIKEEPTPIIIIDEDELKDEIELWNDEVGMLLDDFEFDAATTATTPTTATSTTDAPAAVQTPSPTASSPAPLPKRQRTSSPRLPPTTMPISMSMSSQEASQQLLTHESLRFVRSEFLGAEENITNMIAVFGGVVIFREKADPVLWTSSTGWKPNTPVRKQIINYDHCRHSITTHISAHFASSGATKAHKRHGKKLGTLYIGSSSGQVHVVTATIPPDKKEDDADGDNPLKLSIVKILDAQEPIISVFVRDNGGLPSLVAVGSLGNVFQVDVDAGQIERGSDIDQSVLAIGKPIMHALVFKDTTFYLSQEGQIYCTYVQKDDELLRIEAPPICVLACSDDNSLYGLGMDGKIFEFAKDFCRYFSPEAENQRIATFNRIVHELQRTIATQSRQESEGGGLATTPPVDVEVITFVQPARIGSSKKESRRHTIRLTMTSTLELDWKAGWSVGICLTPATSLCLHDKPSQANPTGGIYQEVFSSLDMLSSGCPWTQDLEIDLNKMQLPLQMSVGIYYQEPAASKTADTTAEGRIQNSAYQHHSPLAAHFFIFDMELDVLHFVEPVLNKEKRRALQPPASSATAAAMAENSAAGFLSRDGGKCQRCDDELTRAMRTMPLWPKLNIRIDTAEVPLQQYLSALLVEGWTKENASGIIQDSHKAVMTLLPISLPRSPERGEGTMNVQQARSGGTIDQDEQRMVWVLLDEEENKESDVVSCVVQVRGHDPKLVMAVFLALQKRTKLMFLNE
ncbi:hypothetical protein BG004_002610, partial [Podila humilis]